MHVLTIAIETVTEEDYDGFDETTKHLSGDINGVKCSIMHVEEGIVDDATCKTNFKDKLTEADYTWDSEA